MPVYEYICKYCGKQFTEIMTVSEHDKKQVRCPRCQSTAVEQQFQTFYAKTSRKS